MIASLQPLAGTNRRLWRYLWGWAVGALAGVWLSLVAVAWYVGHHEAREITDGQLMATGRLWLATAPEGHRSVTPALSRQGMRTYVQDVVVLQWEAGALSVDTHGLAGRLPFTDPPAPGLSTVMLRPAPGETEPEAWRMFVLADPQRQVAVLLDIDQRYDLASDLAFKLVRPALLIMPVIALVLGWAIRRGLRPLDRLSHEVATLDTRTGQRLIPHDRFAEFASTVTAINGLLDRLQSQAQRERQFASDVAHELRTPLTSMALQAAVARQSPTPERLDQLEREALRGGRILAQLLDLARAQRTGGSDSVRPGVEVALGEVAAEVVAAHAPLAYESGHDIALVQPDHPVTVRVNRLLLELALRNLVENALRHTPPQTQVCVTVWQDATGCGLSVSDDGQRLRAAAGSLVKAPLGDGLGLGLRLVERMAEEMQAQWSREAVQPPWTTSFGLRWPAGSRSG